MSEREKMKAAYVRAKRNLHHALNNPDHRPDWLRNLRLTYVSVARPYLQLYGRDATNGERELLWITERALAGDNSNQTPSD
jgi:hypothetical protein